MDKHAKRRAELRPHGLTNAPCQNCYFLDQGGGIESSRPLLNCFDETCCRDGSCDWVCPDHPKFEARVREINGLAFDDLSELKQNAIILPRYIPVIDHGSRRHDELDCPFVALNTYRVIRAKSGQYRTVAGTPEGLRAKFGLRPTTNVILRGVAKDPPLESAQALYP